MGHSHHANHSALVFWSFGSHLTRADHIIWCTQTLSTIAENLLREPENPRYHTFKHENDTIKRRLIQPKGALEYALEVGPASLFVPRPLSVFFDTCHDVAFYLAWIPPKSESSLSIVHRLGGWKNPDVDARGGCLLNLKVMNLQSHYVFKPSKMADLRIGAAMLREAIDRETEKEERVQRNREEQKAAAAAVAQNVRFFFLVWARRVF